MMHEICTSIHIIFLKSPVEGCSYYHYAQPCQNLFSNSQDDNYGMENRNKTGFPLCGVETLMRLWLLLFCSTAGPDSEKNVLVANNTFFTAATIPRLTGHGSPPNLESSVCSTKLRVIAATFDGCCRWSESRGLAWDVGA